MKSEHRHHDPTWPYEDVEEREDIDSEPTWRCGAGFCDCPDAHERPAEPTRISIVLCDEAAKPMPRARCRVLVNGVLFNEEQPHTDGDGRISVETPHAPNVVMVEWAPPDTPIEPRFPFRQLHYVDFAPGDRSESARRRLHNMGFSARASLEGNVEAFQRAFDRPVTRLLDDIEADLVAFHDQGKEPPRGRRSTVRASAVDDGARPDAQSSPLPGPAGRTRAAPARKPDPGSRFTNAEAIQRFKTLVDDAEVINNGQFVWNIVLRDKMESFILQQLAAHPPLKDDFPTMLGGRLAPQNPLRALLVSEDVNSESYITSKKKALKLLKKHDDTKDPVRKLTKALRTSASKAQALGLCDVALALYKEGKDSSSYKKPFDDPTLLVFDLVVHMVQACIDKCFALVTATARRLKFREADGAAGLRGPPPPVGSGHPVNNTFLRSVTLPFGRDRNGRPDSTASFGQIVVYGEHLAASVTTMQKIFDPGDGWVVRAGVLSGLLANKGMADPDHWILILGNEANDFAFWDTDPGATSSIERNFGLMFFRKGDGSASDVARFPTDQHAEHGRLSTSLTDSGLRCIDGIDGTQSDGRNHRYQVTHLTAL